MDKKLPVKREAHVPCKELKRNKRELGENYNRKWQKLHS